MTTPARPDEARLEERVRAKLDVVLKAHRMDSLNIHNPAHLASWTDIEELPAALTAERARTAQLEQAAEMLWVVLAFVSGGDWTKQSPEWQEAAERWRDNYFTALGTRLAPPGDEP